MLKIVGYQSIKNVRMIPGTLKTYNKYKFEINKFYFEKLKKLRPLFMKIDEIYYKNVKDRKFHIKNFSPKDEVHTEKQLNEKLNELINKQVIFSKPHIKNEQGRETLIENIFLFAAIFVILSNDKNEVNDKELERMLKKFENYDSNEVKKYFDLFKTIFDLDLYNAKKKERYSLKDVKLSRGNRNPMLDYFQKKSDDLVDLNKHIKKVDLIKNYEFEYHNLLDLEIEEIYKKNEKTTEYQLKKTQRKVDLELDTACLEYLCLKPLEAELNHISESYLNNNNLKSKSESNINNIPNSNNNEQKFGDKKTKVKFKVYKLSSLNNKKSSYLNVFGKILYNNENGHKKISSSKIQGLSKLKRKNVVEMRDLISANLKDIQKKSETIKKSIHKKEIFKDITEHRLRYDIDSDSTIKNAIKEFF